MTRTAVVGSLQWARRLEHRPDCIPQGRPRGVKATGLVYERQIAKAWPAAQHGPWFEFMDSAGLGYCQPDFVQPYGNTLYVMEAKLTWTAEGQRKLRDLYVPVVKQVWEWPVFGFQIAKKLTLDIPADVMIASSAYEAQRLARAGCQVVLHWIGIRALVRAA